MDQLDYNSRESISASVASTKTSTCISFGPSLGINLDYPCHTLEDRGQREELGGDSDWGDGADSD